MHWFHLCFEVLVPETLSTTNPRRSFTTDTIDKGPLSPFPADIFDTHLLPTYRVGTVQRVKKGSKAKSKTKSRKAGSAAASGIREQTLDAAKRPQIKDRNDSRAALRKAWFQNRANVPLDWRIGGLEIEWFDMNEEQDAGLVGGNEDKTGEHPDYGVERSRSADVHVSSEEEASRVAGDITAGTQSDPSPYRRSRTRSAKKRQKAHTTPTSGAFIPFQCGKTELNAGILHLYRERAEVENVLAQSSIPLQPEPGQNTATANQMETAKGTGTILCVLAVPSYMTAQDFLTFVGPLRQDMAHLRIVRDSIPNRYMVLIKFRDPSSAQEFYKEYNGREYSSLEPEMCHVVYIKSVEFKSHAIPPYAFPPLPDDPSSLFLPSRLVTTSSTTTAASSYPDISPVKSPTGAVTTTQLLELPTCPVCLDRMDASASGLLTIVCHHTFHCHCLSKWGDSSCPVCRYSSKFSSSATDPDDDDMLNECMECGSTDNVWICLICGNIGCGRYQEGHAQSHFGETQHLYAMELETQRVWDYAGDGYVHRLIQNRTDGKLVELPAPNNNHTGGMTTTSAHYYDNRNYHNDNMVSTKKMESLGLEYTYLLTSQLESQRLWYESRLASLESHLSSRIDSTTALLLKAHQDRDAAIATQTETLTALTRAQKDLRTMEARVTKLLDRTVATEKQLVEERALTASLLANQDHYKRTIAGLRMEAGKKEEEVKELNEQIRDLMAFLDTREQCQNSDLQGASLLAVPAPNPTPGTPKRKAKGRK
ncbi:BRCA1-associated protein 2-domain-containing protein [Powellomyces hirtus]|nr:BRCA1-associated protein 2-domain-containing protein [Powellomyces hirtus]